MSFIWVCVKKGLTPCGFQYFCNMDIEVITIGDELLIGQTVDTNSVYLAQTLGPLGLNISRKTAIRDTKDSIISTITEAFSRVNLIILTGGLGPTNDDITKSVLQTYFNCGTRIDETVLQQLKQIFKGRDPELFEINKIQANLPDCAETLFNSQGTAPGMWFEQNSKYLAAMPGVPGEVRAITEESLIPKISQLFKLPATLYKTLTTALIPESLISQKLQNFELNIPGCGLAYLPSHNMVKLRLTRIKPELSTEVFNAYWEKLQEELGDWVFSSEDLSMAEWLIQTAKSNQVKIATAESCTGGFIANQIVQVTGASSVFNGSVTAYDNEVKTELLGVDPNTIETYGAVSAEVAEQMVTGVCDKLKSEIGIATTGIAGPGNGTNEKPSGTIYIAVKFKDQITIQKYLLRGGRLDFMIRAMNTAMKQLKEML